jgi:hypothetical protein
VLSSDRKGAIAEAKIAAAAVELGISILRPINEHARYDLGFDVGDKILRVQCKWGRLDDDGAVVQVQLQGSWLSPTAGYVMSSYSADEIDLVAVYCHPLRPLLPSANRPRCRQASHLPEAHTAEERPEGMH